MFELLKICRRPTIGLGVAALLGLTALDASAQPANDNWVNAEQITGGWGSVTNDNTGATAEAGEPSHAGIPASASIWYQWTAPISGEVSIDTYNSDFDTVLGVYTGTNVTQLVQVGANNDALPFPQYNIISGYSTALMLQRYLRGPSAVRFNATAGTTYYIALDCGIPGTTGTAVLNWAYHPSGVFRFASEDYDITYGLPLYTCSEWESFATEEVSTVGSYFLYDVQGVLVTVTRVAGSTGRVLVDYETVDLTAVGGQDYVPVQGTLVFDDFEMTKNILVQIIPDFFIPQPNRYFGVRLSNPRRDPKETGDVSAPRVDNTYGQAVVKILDTDIPPTFSTRPTNIFNFGKAHYYIPEDVTDTNSPHPYTLVRILVERSPVGIQDAVTVNYRVNNYLLDDEDVDEEDNNYFALQPESDYATPTPTNAAAINGINEDFDLVQGTLSWNANDLRPKEITFTVPNDTITEFNEDFHIFLFRPNLDDVRVQLCGQVAECSVTILFDDMDPPAGCVDEWHNADFSLDMAPPLNTIPPQMVHPGADGIVYSLAVQPDGRTVLGGDFFSYNTTPRNRIARVNGDGGIDLTFDPGDGANGFVSSVNLLANGGFFVTGGFSAFDGIQRNGVALLDAYGNLDTSFDPGAGASGSVLAAAVQPDGKFLIAGEFTSYDRVSRLHVARLNVDGTLDTTFDPGANGPDGTVWTMALQADGKILLGGEFTSVGGLVRRAIVRLNANGTVDTSFNPGEGINGPVYTVALRADGRIWAGGEFSKVHVSNINRFVRLNSNGSIDNSFDPGTGADGTVFSIANQPDGSVYVGGAFTKFNGTHRLGLTRLYADGTVDTTFLDTAYNQFAGLHRARFNDPAGTVFSSAVLPNGNVVIGGNFSQVGGGQQNLAIQYDPDMPTATNNVYVHVKGRDGVRNRSNFAQLVGGATPGPGNMGLLYPSYSVNRKQGLLSVTMMRTNGNLGLIAANFAVQPGLAQAGVDYVYNSEAPIYMNAWPNDRMRSDGMFLTNTIPQDRFNVSYLAVPYAKVNITILNNDIRGNTDTYIQLANPLLGDAFFLGGANIPLSGALGLSRAPLTIVDDDHRPGTLSFSEPEYRVSENGTNVVVTVIRTNGSYGTVSVDYSTTNGTALANTDYKAVSGSLSFGNGQTNKTFTVPLVNNGKVQPIDRLFGVFLKNPNGGASLGLSNAVVTIVDDDYPPGYITFTSGTYVTNETSGFALVAVTRSGGNRGTVTVQMYTTNGTALAGVDYASTNLTLQWDSGDSTERYVPIPLIHDNLVGPDKAFQVVLANATVNTTNAPIVLAGAPVTTTVNIIDDDRYGNLQFSAPSYLVNENGGFATITVIRTDGAAQNLTVNFTTIDGPYAMSGGPLPNFVATNGILTFGPGELSKSFNIKILDDGLMDPELSDFYFSVNLSGVTPAGAGLGYQTNALVYILDTQTYNQPAGSPDTTFSTIPGFNGDVYTLALQPDGRILAGGAFTVVNNTGRNRLARLYPDASLDTSFLDGLSGANGAVRAVLSQTDGRIVVGGAFTQMNGVNRNHLARLASNGILDTSFNPSFGSDNTVFALAESFVDSARRILVGGNFTKVNGLSRRGLARLNNDGSIDPNFNPSLDINGSIYSIVVYPTNTINPGKILIGGDFNSVNGSSRNGIARLNQDGSLDPTFDPGAGGNDTVRTLALQLDGRVLVGGSFTTFGGQASSHIARLNSDGSVDAAFDVGLGTDDTVTGIAIQRDNRIVLVGQFTKASGVSRNHITRLLPNGTVDPAINFGFGADDTVYSVVIQPDDGMLLLGGAFTHYDEQALSHVARVYSGALAGSGAFTFTVPEFAVDETATNATITVRRTGGTAKDMTVTFSTSDDSALNGVNYSNVTVSLYFPEGETFQALQVPVMSDQRITDDLHANLTLSNPLPPSALGDQPVARLTIINNDAAVKFASDAYSVREDIMRGVALINVIRQGSTRLTSSVLFFTSTNGTAWAGTNYIATTNTVVFQPGETNQVVSIPILNVPGPQGDTTVVMMLTNASQALLFSPSVATLTILDVDLAPGSLLFSSTNYVANEADGAVPITVARTNGHTGNVSVRFETLAGTAAAGVKYIGTNGVLTFADGELTKTLFVPLVQENVVEGNLDFFVRLSNPTGGAAIIGTNTARVVIMDDDVGVFFASPVFVGTEKSGTVTLTVYRVGTNGVTYVNYATTNGTAIAGSNYQATYGSLMFTNGESMKTFAVPLIYDPNVTGDQSFQVRLYNPSAPAALGTPSVATVMVLDSDPGVSFTNNAFYTVKSGTNVLITVVRSNANTGIVSVNYSTFTNLDDTAIAGLDYVATSGSLTFSNGIAFQSFTVPIISNRIADVDRTFSVLLFTNQYSGVHLLEPSVAMVTITNDVAGLSFSSPGYSVSEKGVTATITVLRTGYTNSTVAVDYFTTDGTAREYKNYQPVSGTFVFTNGETVKTFSVPIIDNSIVEGDHTVLLSLANPLGNAVLTSTNASVLTIIEADGSLIVPAGSALVAENSTVNGIVDTNETVTMLFALRNASGNDTVNLVADLLPGNGVSSPSGSQEYGVLKVHGPSVSRPFSFTASGTNGQVLAATFSLHDGSTVISNVVFNFVLGTSTIRYSNAAPIYINDFTKASPYPATINVSGVGTMVTKASVTLSNIYHSWPSDIDILLASPSGQKSYLMAKVGGSFALTKTTLTFDDDAPGFLPFAPTLTNRIFSSTNKPSAYAPAPPPFPIPAPPGPYPTNLTGFIGDNPNGLWSLFVYDDSRLNSGIISNGWMLDLTTAAVVSDVGDLGVALLASSPTVVATSNLTYYFSVTNYGPSTSTGVAVKDVLPPGLVYVSSQPGQGTVSTAVPGVVTWNVGSLDKDEGATLAMVVQANQGGTLSNWVTVSALTADPNPDNNSAYATNTVISPIADLTLALSATPGPILFGKDLAYGVTVANYGPAVAPHVIITNILPAQCTLVSATPNGWYLKGNILTFTNLGDLGSGMQLTVNYVVRPTAPGTLTALASCRSGVLDPFKANNSGSVKTEVEGLVLNVAYHPGSMVLSWSTDAGNAVLDRATNIAQPIIWAPADLQYIESGGINSVTIPIGTGTEYFRLRLSTP